MAGPNRATTSYRRGHLANTAIFRVHIVKKVEHACFTTVEWDESNGVGQLIRVRGDMKVVARDLAGSFLAISLLFPLAPAAATLSYQHVKVSADRDELSLGDQQGALTRAQAIVLAPVLAACANEKGVSDQSAFVVVFELDILGRIINTWRKGESSIAMCFEMKVKGLLLFRPPRAPFYSSFDMKFER